MSVSRLVVADEVGRVAVGEPGRSYRVWVEPDGVVVVEPVESAEPLSQLEGRFVANAELQAGFAYARAHPQQRVARRRDR